jgi:hypothetical protein
VFPADGAPAIPPAAFAAAAPEPPGPAFAAAAAEMPSVIAVQAASAACCSASFFERPSPWP